MTIRPCFPRTKWMNKSKKRFGKEERRSNLTGRSWQLLKSRTGSGTGMHGDCCLWALWPVCHFNYLWQADSRAININLSLSHHTISCPASAASLSTCGGIWRPTLSIIPVHLCQLYTFTFHSCPLQQNYHCHFTGFPQVFNFLRTPLDL